MRIQVNLSLSFMMEPPEHLGLIPDVDYLTMKLWKETCNNVVSGFIFEVSDAETAKAISDTIYGILKQYLNHAPRVTIISNNLIEILHYKTHD